MFPLQLAITELHHTHSAKLAVGSVVSSAIYAIVFMCIHLTGFCPNPCPLSIYDRSLPLRGLYSSSSCILMILI